MSEGRFKQFAAVMLAMSVVGCGGSGTAPKSDASKSTETTLVEVARSSQTTQTADAAHPGASAETKRSAPSSAAKKEMGTGASPIILPDPATDAIGAKGPDLPLR